MNDAHDLLGNGGVRIAVIGTLAILALFLFMQTASVAENFGRSDTPPTNTITVQGSGQVNMAPDVARISFTVEHTAASVKEAQDATTKQANAAIAYVKTQNIAAKDIRTQSYNISPQYSYPRPCPPGALCPEYENTTPKVTGYHVSQSIQVMVRDLEATGVILGGLGELEVQNISGPDLTLDDPTAAYNFARAQAIQKAKMQASILADQLGVRLGRIVSFNESSSYPYPVYARALEAKDSVGAPAPEIPIGENEYSADVTIVYEIR